MKVPDLIEKFFREDLTEAEEQALSGMLDSSEEAAERFGGLAEAAYYRFGHPKPEWEGPDALPPRGGGGLKPWTWLVALATVAGLAYWAWGKKGEGQLDASMPPALKEARQPLAEKAPRKLKGRPEEAAPGTQGESRKPPQAAAPPLVGKVPEKGAAGVPEPRTILTPVNLDEHPTHKFSSISVKINQAQAGLVKVRVLDMAGEEITPLYEGELPARWVFDWDGKLGNGRMVAPGYYRIEVESGSFTGHKNIRIQ
jgi:hypothetical protein